jgi:hypothetical protein
MIVPVRANQTGQTKTTDSSYWYLCLELFVLRFKFASIVLVECCKVVEIM